MLKHADKLQEAGNLSSAVLHADVMRVTALIQHVTSYNESSQMVTTINNSESHHVTSKYTGCYIPSLMVVTLAHTRSAYTQVEVIADC